MFLQLSELQPALSSLNDTLGEMSTLFENAPPQSGVMDLAGMLRTSSILLCQRELVLNETDEEQQYIDRFRRGPDASLDSTDNASYVYDNSTS